MFQTVLKNFVLNSLNFQKEDIQYQKKSEFFLQRIIESIIATIQ